MGSWKAASWSQLVAVWMIVGMAAPRVFADPLYKAVNLIPDAVRGLNDSGQLIASWGQTLPTVYDGYGVWAGETRADSEPAWLRLPVR